MRAKHLVLINWGTVPTGTYELANTTAITGQTGAGKSTQLDALVTLMSAGMTQIGRLNMASDDGSSHRSKRKSYRRAEEYVVGMAKDGLCRSPLGAHAYVAIAFEPDQGEENDAQPFTAVMAIAARFSEGEPQNAGTCFAIVAGHLLDHTVFAPEANGRREIVEVSECLEVLRGQYGIRKGPRKTGVIGFKDEPKKFLRHLWGFFSGREDVSQEQADRASMVWCRFVPQEGIEDVSHFVRTLIMPDPRGNVDFQGIRKLIRTNQELTRRAKALQNQKTLLAQALDQCRTHTSSYFLGRAFAHDALKSIHAKTQRERKVLADLNIGSLSLLELRQAERQDELDGAQRAHAQVVTFDARLKGIAGHNEYERLEAEIAAAHLALQGERGKAEIIYLRLEQVAQYVESLEAAAIAKPLGDLAAAVQQALARTGLSKRLRLRDVAHLKGLAREPSVKELEALAVAAQPLEAPFFGARTALSGEGRDLLALHAASRDRARVQKKNAEEQLLAAQTELADLETRGRIQPPEWASDTKAYIEKHLPSANPVFLYEMVKDVKNPEWQLAIEGEINLARFNIRVDLKLEQAVDNLLRQRKGRNASLIQGNRALAEAQGKPLPESSIASELIVDDPVARAYLLNQYGRVPKLKDSTDTTMERRGVRKDGRAAGSFTTYNADERAGRLYFGTRAVEKRKEELGEQIPRLTSTVQEWRDVLELLARVHSADDALFKLGDDSIGACVRRALARHTEIDEKKRELGAMDITEFKAIKAEREHWAELQKEHAESAERINEVISAEQREIENRSRRIADIDGQAEGLDKQLIDATNERARLSMTAPWVTPGWIEEKLAQCAASGKPLIDAISELRRPIAVAITQIGLIGAKYNDAIGSGEVPLNVLELMGLAPDDEATFLLVATKYTEIDRRIATIAADELSEASTALAQHESVMRQRFTEYFCDKLLLELSGAKKVLDQLNDDLRSHVFGAERYEFEAFDASTQFALRRAFFEHVKEEARRDDRFNPFDAPLSPEMLAVRDEIVRLLSSEEEKDQKLLEMISDYRNYHLYEMYKVFQRDDGEKPTRIAMSTNGKESGGEKENGILVARAATISSALGLRERGPRLRFVAIDEMMKKTDEARIRESLEFLVERLNLQVLFVMPTRAIGPFKDLADLEYNVSRVNTARPEGTLRDKVVVLRSRYERAATRAMREERAARIRAEVIQRFDRDEPVIAPTGTAEPAVA